MYDPTRIYLMGHSCSAHMLTSIFLDSSPVSPTLTPSLPLQAAVQAIIMSEGIYDLDLLLSTFPSYREWFVENAFGQRESYADFSTTKFRLRNSATHIRWLVIHSKGDSLVDAPQSEAIYTHLCEMHEAVGISANSVSQNTHDLKEEHNQILRGDDFVKIVGEFILGHTVTPAS